MGLESKTKTDFKIYTTKTASLLKLNEFCQCVKTSDIHLKGFLLRMVLEVYTVRRHKFLSILLVGQISDHKFKRFLHSGCSLW